MTLINDSPFNSLTRLPVCSRLLDGQLSNQKFARTCEIGTVAKMFGTGPKGSSWQRCQIYFFRYFHTEDRKDHIIKLLNSTVISFRVPSIKIAVFLPSVGQREIGIAYRIIILISLIKLNYCFSSLLWFVFNYKYYDNLIRIC